MSKSKVPQIRFKGFNQSWKISSIEELISENIIFQPKDGNHGNIHPKSTDYVPIGIPFIMASNVRNGYIDITNCSHIKIIQANSLQKGFSFEGDVLLTHKGTVGEVAVVPKINFPYIMLTPQVTYYRVKNKKKLSNYFLSSAFLSNRFSSNLKEASGGGTRAYVGIMEQQKLEISIPEEINEQTKIGNYFQQLDKLIEEKEKKHQKLKQFKKAMLDKMFPKNGANTPEVRFEGFSGEWKKRKFKDNIISIQTGTNLLANTINKGIPLIKMGNIQRGCFSFEKVEYLDENIKVEEENIANYGDFFFNTRNTLELVGKGATWMRGSGLFAFNNNIARFKFEDINTIFFNYLYNTSDMINQVHARAMGTTSVAAIYPKNLNSIEYHLPNQEEQTKIGNYFQTLDKQIDLQNKEIEKLKNIKKASLDKMFV